VLRWHDLYALAGSASASLIGLLFVSVSMHIDIMAQATDNEDRILAVQTVSSFLYVLVIAMVFMVPAQNPWGLSVPLLAMGILGCIRMLQTWRRFLRARDTGDRGKGTHYSLWHLAYPTFSYLALAAVSLAALRGRVQALVWLLLVVVMLLLDATRSAWDLMILVAMQKSRGS
jgi:hypothetical protein